MSTFSGALIELKYGNRVARKGWNGKGMWLVLVNPNEYSVSPYITDCNGGQPLDLLPWIGMKTACGSFVPWLASQTDILANDWEVVP